MHKTDRPIGPKTQDTGQLLYIKIQWTLFSILLLSVSFFQTSPVYAAEENPMRFSGGRTSVSMQEGREVVSLAEGAELSVGDMRLSAASIEISGPDYRYVRCAGNVAVIDSGRGINLSASELFFDRTEELIVVDGWVEIQDVQNEVIASGAWLEFDLDGGVMRMQMRVKLLKHTDKDAMVCIADNIVYDRDGETLALNGGSKIIWDGDSYEAATITVDLRTNDIVMEGTVKGLVHG